MRFTAAEIDAGRKLFAADWQFAAAAGTAERLPPMKGIEVAVAGRSNVGKSSLINALTSRKALARTSHTPGRTQELIYFAAGAESPLRLVDMPGYGYADASKAKIAAWTALIHAYLAGRANLARVYVLVSISTMWNSRGFAILPGATNGGALSGGCRMLTYEVSGCPVPLRGSSSMKVPKSSREGTGMPELRAAVARVVRERSN